MVNLDSQTLLASLQAVRDQVFKYETLLESDTVTDIETYEELLLMYKEALSVLSSHYQGAVDSGENLPPLDAVLHPGKGRDSAQVLNFSSDN
jgi:hypothetical protein